MARFYLNRSIKPLTDAFLKTIGSHRRAFNWRPGETPLAWPTFIPFNHSDIVGLGQTNLTLRIGSVRDPKTGVVKHFVAKLPLELEQSVEIQTLNGEEPRIFVFSKGGKKTLVNPRLYGRHGQVFLLAYRAAGSEFGSRAARLHHHLVLKQRFSVEVNNTATSLRKMQIPVALTKEVEIREGGGAPAFITFSEDLTQGGKRVVREAHDFNFSMIKNGRTLEKKLSEYVEKIMTARRYDYSVTPTSHLEETREGGLTSQLVKRMFFIVINPKTNAGRLIAGDLNHITIEPF